MRQHISAILRPSAALIGQLGRVGVHDPKEAENVCRALDTVASIDGLERTIEQGMIEVSKGSGHVTPRALAEYLFRVMKENQR